MSGRTIGVTLPIPAPYGSRLDVVRAQFGPDAHEMPAHVTVLPPIDVDDEVLPEVVAHLAAVAASTAPFRLVLSGVDSFRPVSPVVFVVIDVGAEDCVRLEQRVRADALGVEARFPYHPHVTIAHSVDEGAMDRAMRELAGFRADVPMSAMSLHERRDDHWSLVQQFDFTGASTG